MGKLLQSHIYPTEIYIGAVGGKSGIKVFSGSEQVWPATNYWNCGYGCQYYASDPSCAQCDPHAINVLTGLYINGPDKLKLDYYIVLSNNYSASSINYVLRISNTTRGTGPISTSIMTVPGYTIDTFFSGTTSSFGIINEIGDNFTVELSSNGGSPPWTTQITPSSGSLNYT